MLKKLCTQLMILLLVTLAIGCSAHAATPIIPHGRAGTVPMDMADLPTIANIPAYGILRPSGCEHFEGSVKLRFDMYMLPEATYYDEHHIYVIDWDSEEAKAGYPGGWDEENGEPKDWDDYIKWEDALPRIWVNTPFHCHFTYFDTEATDLEIKEELAAVTEYFYAFHLYCWVNGKVSIEEWQKVAPDSGTIKTDFTPGISSASACEAKAEDVKLRSAEFDTRLFEKVEKSPPDLGIRQME